LHQDELKKEMVAESKAALRKAMIMDTKKRKHALVSTIL
jgi:hypothetical protein